VWNGRNPFAVLDDDTPDDPRLGKRLILAAIALGAIRWCWPHLEPHSFGRISAWYVRIEPYFKRGSEFAPSDFGFDAWFAIFLVAFIGTFIFFRRGVWWWQDREDEKSITRLNLK